MEIDKVGDIRNLIISIVKDEFKFWRHYIGEVKDNKDSLDLGRVQVTIPEQGFFSQEQAIWCWPRQSDSMSVPLIGSWVEIWFIGGDPGRPVYLGYASEVQEKRKFKNYSSPVTRVLFESPKTQENLTYNDDDKKFVFNEGDEAFVLGNTLKIELQKIVDALTQLNTDFTTWVVAPNDGGAALKTKVMAGFVTKAQAVLTGILSTGVFGK
jgi:hypothetical protein